MSRLGPTGLTQLLTDIKNWVLSKIPTKTSQLTNDSNFLTSHQSLSNYSTLANTVKSISISGKTITVTPGSGSAYTLTTQDTNTDTLVTQNVSTTNSAYPILLCATANATANQGAKTSIFGSGVKVNPSTSTITATTFSGALTGNVTGNCSGSSGSCTGNAATATKATGNANGKELTNTIIKGLSISGKTITYTQIDGTTGTLTTQDTNTDTLMTQNVSTTNNKYPILLCPTAEATANQGAKTGIFGANALINPSTGEIISKSNGTGAFRVVGGNYGFFIRNDGSNTYFLLTASGDQYGTWTSARPLTINDSTGVCSISGNAATATQFSANKDVTLTGYINGTASSKAGWSIATALKNCYFRTTGTVTNTYFKVASGTLTGGWNRYETLIRFVETTGNASCTLRIYMQLDGSSLFDAGHVTVLNSVNFGTSVFNVVYKNDTDKTLFEIYYQLTPKNHQVNALVLYETERKLVNSCDVLTMYNDSTPVAALPSDYTLLTTEFELYCGDLVPAGNNKNLGSSDAKWSNVYATTFTGNLTGNVTGNCSGSSGSCTGNANTATQFSANKAVTLTGDVTGTASSKAGWSVATTLANSGVTAGSYGPTADVTGNNNATISVPQITVDAKGRVTSVTNRTLTCKNNTYNVYNKTLTIQKNGTNVATFTSNSNTDVTANITVPTKTSELTNDSGFLTSHQSLDSCVKTTGNQLIAGWKQFTGDICVKNTAITDHTAAPSADTSRGLGFWDNNNKYWGDINHTYLTTGASEIRICMTNWSTSGSQGWWCLKFGVDKNFSQVYFIPNGDNGYNLGDSTHRWHFVYANSFKGTLSSKDDTISYTTANALYFYSGQPAIANCSEGSSNDFTKFSYPTGATSVSSSNANIQSLRLVWSDTWWHEIFSSPNKEYLWHRNINGGNARGWRRIVEENVSGLTNQTWNINIGGSSASCTGNCSGSSSSCTGNAATATQFSANTTVALTGDATGTSAGSKKGWSVPVTLANSGVTAGTYGPSADVTGNNNATISVPEITVDAKGRVTSVTNRTLTCKNNTYNVYNKTLTIQKNGTNVATFTSNSNTDVTANITVPTKTSELTNDSGFLTSHQSLSNYVTLNGTQTITGAKTFTGDVIGISKDNSTENANDLYSTTAGSKLTYYTTTNGGTKLTNVPAAVNTTLESRTIRKLSDSDWIVEQICHNSNGLYYRKGSNGTWGAWKTFAFTDSNISGTAANVTGTVAIANGGTGATTRLGAVKNLTNENVGTGTQYFLTITSNWGKAGYCSVADAKTALGLGSAAYTASTAYAAASHTHTKSQITDFPTKVSAFTNDSKYACSLSANAINFDWSTQYPNKVGIRVDTTWLGGILTTANTTIPTKTSELTNDSGFLTSHQDLSLYPYKVSAYSSYGNGRWPYRDLGDTTTYPNGFNEIVTTGKYQVRFTSSTPNSPCTVTSTATDGILEIEGISSAGSVSSYQRIVQRFYKYSSAHIVYFRAASYHDGQWNWSSSWTVYGDIVTHNANEFLTSHQSLSNYVTLNGAQTISGTKTFSAIQYFNEYKLVVKATNQTVGTTPRSNKWNGMVFQDTAGTNTFTIENGHIKNGSTQLNFSCTPNISGAARETFLQYYCGTTEGASVLNILTATACAPTPAAGDNSTKIATTAFVRSGYVQINTSGYAIGDICLCKFFLKDIGNNLNNGHYSIARGKTGIAGSSLLEVTFECSSANDHPIYKTSGSALSGTWVYLGITMSNISSIAATYYPFIALFKRSA